MTQEFSHTKEFNKASVQASESSYTCSQDKKRAVYANDAFLSSSDCSGDGFSSFVPCDFNSYDETSFVGSREAHILGYNVERLRKQANMDKARFAQMAGITRPTLYKIERGESDLKLSYIKKLSLALGVSVVELLSPPTNDTSSNDKRLSGRY